ncbi:hypothetical protein K402DRAFT_392565 [Aulographum hederae CBS 113979]|uniref:Uncharacterized protein n=1 Tax=Aulographum hederae CBS 113979 TaxID=1176131 RepID=A0A6G1H3Y1_9PEZI|nr:hypothetical protein K402DRAFT_392565 [Aulographum hederae CBS 113979]
MTQPTTSPSALPRPPFNPVDTARPSGSKDEVESPGVSTNSTALCRFEFESGRGNEGTKILMVEWEDDAKSRGGGSGGGSWHVEWEGKSTVLRADDEKERRDSAGGAGNDGVGNNVKRMYFLLPPGVAVPPTVRLTYQPSQPEQQTGSKSNRPAPSIVYHTNPLPAIFPPALGASARTAGKKGVLHTIWAKKRLQALQKEIEEESRNNVESVGLTMIVQEKEWIEHNFGVTTRPGNISIPSSAESHSGGGATSPTSPRTPGGGRLAEKLKGLKLGTSERDLSSPSSLSTSSRNPLPSQNQRQQEHPLSPDASDVAVSSFAAIKGFNPNQLGAKPPQQPSQQSQPLRRGIASHTPPPDLVSQQREAGIGSLNAFASSSSSSSGGMGGMEGVLGMDGGGKGTGGGSREDEGHEGHDEEDLFALPMSPRSPEMSKSPFSFAASDTVKYLKGEKI